MSTRYFLALDGVNGDSLDAKHAGWFEVSNFDIDLTGAGGGAGTAFSPLTLTLDSNTGLAPLLALAASGRQLNGATLVGVTDGAGQVKVYQLDLADVQVTNVEHHADPAAEVGPTLTLDYGQIELETFTPDGTGAAVPEGQFGFDLAAGTDGITVPSADPGGSVAASPQAMDYFMLIDGLNGGSQNPQHQGWFEIKGVDLNMENLAAGDFASLNVTMSGGTELADLMKIAATGANLSGRGVVTGVHIEGFRAGAAQPTKVYDLTLANVAVSDVAVTHDADGENLDYTLSLDYGKIALVTNGIDGSGNPVKNGEFGYDVTNHTAIAPFSLALQTGSANSSVGGVQYFLALDGAGGEVSPAFKGPGAVGLDSGVHWFEVNSFDLDMQGVGLHEPGIVKEAAFSPLTLTLDSNAALPPLLTMAATDDPTANTAIKAATLVGVRADGETVTYRLDLGTLLVTKVEDVADAGLTVSLDFEQIKLWTFSQDNSGVISHANDFTWNVAEKSDVISLPTLRHAGIAPRAEAATYFMLIDGLNGGSTDPSHKGWFELSSFDFDLKNASSFGSAGANIIAKPQFSSLSVALPNEVALADVMNLAATGGLIKGVRIEGVTDGTTPAKVYELSLGDVVATKVADGAVGGYNLSLDYGQIEVVTKDQSGTPTEQFFYNVVTNSDSGVHPSSLTLTPASSGGLMTPLKYFLALDGVKGDSLDSTYQGWFEIADFNIDLDNAFVGVPGGPGGGPGNPDFSPLTLTLNSNTGLAPLLERAATGGHIDGATLVGVNASGQQVYQLDLADVQATKVEGDAVAGLTLSLDYGKIELQTFTQNGTGGVVPEGQFGFDRIANTSNVMVPSALPSGSVASSPQPATYFMLIDGVNGGSTDAQHKGWFEITGVDLDVAHMRLPASGEANFSPLIVIPENDADLAGVMDLAATGGLVKGVHIEGFLGGATAVEVYDLTLADVMVTKVADGEDDGYSLSFDYGKIALVTNGIDATGQPTTNGEFGFDVVNGAEIAPFSLALNPGHDPVANTQNIDTDEDTATPVTLSGSDTDGDSLTFTVVSGPAHGTLSGAGANLTYTPAANYNGPDSFTYVANDGWTDSEAAIVSLTVHAVNDNAIITGTTTGNVTEAGGFNNGTAGVPTASGNLDSTDFDNPPADTWQVVGAGAASIGGFGVYAVAADGTWTYTLDDSDPAVQALNGTATLTDTFYAATQDGTAQLVTITIHAQNDAALLSADVRDLTETNSATDISSSGTLTITDPDSATTFVAQAGTVGLYGAFGINTAGVWTYTASSAHNEFAAGATYTDTFSVASADGTLTSVTINIAGSNDTPVANAQSIGANKDTAIAVTLSGSDVDGDSLAFTVLSGPAHGTLSGSGANRIYTPDADYLGPDSFSYVANDGTLDSAAAPVSLNVHVNIAPVVTAFDQSAVRGQVFDASTLFSASDGDGDTLLYFFYDNSADPGSGHFTVNGVVQAANITFAVNAAQLAQTTFTAGAFTSDDLYVNTWDFSLFSGPQQFHINVPVNHVPTATASDQSATRGQVFNASSLFSASDTDSDGLLYFFYDNSSHPTSGYFTVNGVVQAANTTFAVSAAQLAQTTFTAGSRLSDDLYVNAWDGHAFSGPQQFHVNVPANHAPTATANDQSASSGQAINASSLFLASDADGDGLLYFFWDNSAAPTSGHFEINGIEQAANTTFAVSSVQLAQTVFVAGAADTTDDLFVNAYDGVAFSGPKAVHVHVNDSIPI